MPLGDTGHRRHLSSQASIRRQHRPIGVALSLLKPTDAETLSKAVVDNLVVAADPYSRQACVYFWEHGRPYTLAVVDAVVGADDPEIVALGRKLLAEPTDPRPYAALRSTLIERA